MDMSGSTKVEGGARVRCSQNSRGEAFLSLGIMERKCIFHKDFEYLQDELEGGNHFLEILRLTSNRALRSTSSQTGNRPVACCSHEAK